MPTPQFPDHMTADEIAAARAELDKREEALKMPQTLEQCRERLRERGGLNRLRVIQYSAIVDVMTVADALNGEDGLIPYGQGDLYRFFIYDTREVNITWQNETNGGFAYFKTLALAEHARTILGDATIKAALGVHE